MGMKTTWWKVYLFDRLIDKVQYQSDCDKDYVYNTLVNHDGYNPNIVVKKESNKRKNYEKL